MFSVNRRSDFCNAQMLWSTMLRDRAAQFIDRHGWPLKKDEHGLEIDCFDDEEAIYCTISEGLTHQASVRLRPVSCGSMAEMFFGDLWRRAEGDFSDSVEITRLCSSPKLSFRHRRDVMSDLMLSACRFAMKNRIHSIIGVVYAPVARLLVKTGCPTEHLVTQKTASGELVFARWIPEEYAIWDIQERRALRDEAYKVSSLDTRVACAA